MSEGIRYDRFPGLFGPTPAKRVHTPGMCFCCNHPSGGHCKGGVKHGRYRFTPGVPAPAGSQFTCTTRHCEEPLCSCTNFAATRADLGRFQKAYEDA